MKVRIKNDESSDIQVFQLDNIKAIDLDTASNILAIYKLVNGLPSPFAVAGNYSLENNTLSFVPLTKLRSDCDFKITNQNGYQYYSPSINNSNIQKAETIFFPISNQTSANTLTFYLEFDHIMKPDSKAYQKVQLLNNEEDVIAMPWRQKSYWINDNKTLVLMLHPGRIKRGIQTTSDLEPIFILDKSITLRLNDTFETMNGDLLLCNASKTYHIDTNDSILPKIMTKAITPPKVNTSDPVTVVFSEEMDYGLLYKWLKITSGEKKISGKLKTKNGVTWDFIPDTRWTKGKYVLSIGNKIGDPSHNQIDRAFETKLGGKVIESYNIDFTFSIE